MLTFETGSHHSMPTTPHHFLSLPGLYGGNGLGINQNLLGANLYGLNGFGTNPNLFGANNYLGKKCL